VLQHSNPVDRFRFRRKRADRLPVNWSRSFWTFSRGRTAGTSFIQNSPRPVLFSGEAVHKRRSRNAQLELGGQETRQGNPVSD
jgi:hypothetical protein